MWVYTLISTVLGAGGFGLGLWNLWRSHRQPIRDLQFERRKFAKKYCEALHHNTMMAEERLRRNTWPDQQVLGELEAARKGFDTLSKELIVPTPAQLLVIRERAIAAEDAINEHIVPTDDSVFDGYIPEIVLSTMAQLNRDLEYMMEGLRKIEQGKALRYKRQFKELG